MTYTVHAKRWAEGWELHIEGEGVTQSRTLETAEWQVRHYLVTLHDHDEVTEDVDIIPMLGDLTSQAAAARAHARAAERALQEAAGESRAVAAALRDAGLSHTDVGIIMGISRARVSQLLTRKSA